MMYVYTLSLYCYYSKEAVNQSATWLSQLVATRIYVFPLFNQCVNSLIISLMMFKLTLCTHPIRNICFSSLSNILVCASVQNT